MITYRNTSSHAEDLEDGRSVGPLENFELSKTAASKPYNKAKIEEGTFLLVSETDDKSEDHENGGDS